MFRNDKFLPIRSVPYKALPAWVVHCIQPSRFGKLP